MPTADELYQEANCFLCYGITQTQALKIALLRRQVLELDPNADVSPEALLASAACYNCYANGSVGDLFELALLAIIAATPCTPGNVDGLIWGPSPETVDSIAGSADALTTFTNAFFGLSAYTEFSFGNPTTVTNAIDFSTNTAITSITFRLLETVGTNLNFNTNVLTSFSAPLLQTIGNNLDFELSAALLNLTLPSLTSVGNQIFVDLGVIEVLSLPVLASYPPLGITADASLLTLNLPACVDDGAGQLNLDLMNMTGLVTLNLNGLVTSTGNFDVSGSINLVTVNLDALTTADSLSFGLTSVTSLSFPSLVTLTTEMLDSALVPVLTSFSAPLLVPDDGCDFMFNGQALDQISVDHILARCVSNPAYVTGIIDLSGGTSSTPSAQGLIDAGILTGRGVVVTTN